MGEIIHDMWEDNKKPFNVYSSSIIISNKYDWGCNRMNGFCGLEPYLSKLFPCHLITIWK